MLKIIHRVNSVSELAMLPKEFGVELDVRNEGRKLILNHEPYGNGESFDAYCAAFRHAFMIVNVKTEGIEAAVLETLAKHKIEKFFLLDLTFPAIVKLSGAGEKRIAVRFSEYEPIEGCLAMKGKVDWVWADTFSRLPLDRKSYALLHAAGFHICLVCPERWGRKGDIAGYKAEMKKQGIEIDSVMTSKECAMEW